MKGKPCDIARSLKLESKDMDVRTGSAFEYHHTVSSRSHASQGRIVKLLN